MTRDNLLATLLLIGLASFILGTGFDSIPAYMTLAILAVPAFIELKIPPRRERKSVVQAIRQ